MSDQEKNQEIEGALNAIATECANEERNRYPPEIMPEGFDPMASEFRLKLKIAGQVHNVKGSGNIPRMDQTSCAIALFEYVYKNFGHMMKKPRCIQKITLYKGDAVVISVKYSKPDKKDRTVDKSRFALNIHITEYHPELMSEPKINNSE